MSSYLRKFQFSSKLSFSSAGESSDKEVGEDEDEVLDHPYDSNNDEIERSKIKMIFMRAHVEKEDPSSKDVDDFMIRRFLRARNVDIEKASALFLKVGGEILFQMVAYLHQRYKMIFPTKKCLCKDKINWVAPLWLFLVDVTSKAVLKSSSILLHFLLTKYVLESSGQEEKFISIADLEGWGYAITDIRGYLAALSILQDCYPERLGKLFIINVPYDFMTTWKVVYPFIDSKQRKR